MLGDNVTDVDVLSIGARQLDGEKGVTVFWYSSGSVELGDIGISLGAKKV